MIKILAYILVFIAPDSANRLACYIKYILQDKSYQKNAWHQIKKFAKLRSGSMCLSLFKDNHPVIF